MEISNNYQAIHHGVQDMQQIMLCNGATFITFMVMLLEIYLATENMTMRDMELRSKKIVLSIFLNQEQVSTTNYLKLPCCHLMSQ